MLKLPACERKEMIIIFLLILIVNKMENLDLNSLGVIELDGKNLHDIGGGVVSPWWSVASQIIQAAVYVLEAGAEAYINYSARTGGAYVIHHAV